MKPITPLQSLLTRSIAVWVACGMLLFSTMGLANRVSVSDNGLFYYVIVETETGRITSQAQMDIGGIESIILPPETHFSIYALFTENLGVAISEFTTPRNGLTGTIPDLYYYDIEDFDTDGDGLSDLREFIVGTNLFNPDTDGDGVNDGPEVQQGLNALDGFIVETGIVGSSFVSDGTTICVSNNLAIVGQENRGITVFNVTDSASPVRVADVAIQGKITDVDCADQLVAVAAGSEGLAVVDVSDPPAAAISRSLHFGSDVKSVVMNGDQAYVGLANGSVSWVDLQTGIELARLKISASSIADLGLGMNVLYAVAGTQFFTIDIKFGKFELVHTLALPGSAPVNATSRRLFVGDTFALLNHNRGYFSVNISDPKVPAVGQYHDLNQFGWKWMAGNGSGMMVAAVSANSTLDGPHHVELYEIGADGSLANQVQLFETPDFARAVSIYNGLAYVVDWKSGQRDGNLLVLNYLPYDSAGLSPSITLVTDAIDNQFEEGKVMTATARVGDDVQVRNVEFFIDGESRFIDGNFPFEYRFPTPLITPTKDQFSIRAVATDTGGNVALAEEIIILLLPDATPPFVMNVIPRDNSIVGNLDTVALIFSEVIDTGTLFGTPPPDAPPETPATPGIRVFLEGEDGVPGTEDDVRVSGSLVFDEDTRTAYFNFTNPAEEGTHLIRVLPTIEDLAGNPMEQEFISRFTQAGFDDSDLDGLPDNVEVILGMDRFNPDTDGDGILDGAEDNDVDGLTNTAEILYNTDPQNPDSDGDTIKDGNEDFDNDGLLNKDEFTAGSDPFDPDSDNDGYDDAGEVAESSDPNDPNSKPILNISSFPIAYMNQNSYGLLGIVNFTVQSDPSSYLNMNAFSLPVGTTVTISSPAASYSNSTEFSMPVGTTVTVAAGVVSYQNNN